MKVPSLNSRISPKRKLPAIPDPQPTLASLVLVTTALKEAVELLTNQRMHGQESVAAPTWAELVNLGVVDEGSVPKRRDNVVKIND
jgi:hypothetical protein